MIYLFDAQEELIKIVRKTAITSAMHKQILTDEHYVSDQLSVEMIALKETELSQLEFMAIADLNDKTKFNLYWIATEETEGNKTTLIGTQSGIEELRKTTVEDQRPKQMELGPVVDRLLLGTNWTARYVANKGLRSTNFYYISVFDALKKACEVWNVEMQFFVEIQGNKIGARYIDFKERVGVSSGERVVYGHNALTILKESDKIDLFTALIGRGKGEEVSSGDDNESGQAGYGRKITFEEIEWSVAKGHPVNKPKGQKYVEIASATAQYGVSLPNGQKRAKIGIVNFDEEEDPERLLQQTYQRLLEVCRPKTTFKTSASYLKGGIGDTVRVVRSSRNLDYETRIFEITYDRLSKKAVDIKLGDRIGLSENAKLSAIADKVSGTVTNNVANYVVQQLASASGFNSNWYGSAEPPRDKVKINDNWYKPDPEHEGHTIILTWTGEVWEEVLRTYDDQQVLEEIKKVDDKVKGLKDEVDTISTRADKAIEDAGGATNLAQVAKNVADSAIANAVELSEKVSKHTIEINEINGSLLEKWTKADVESFVQTSISNEAGAINKALVEVKGSFPKISGIRNLLKGTRDGTIANVPSFITQDKLGDLTIISGSGANGYIHLIDTEMTIEAKDEGYIGSFFAKADTPMDMQLFLTGGQIKSVETSVGTKSTFGDGAITIPITTRWERYWVKWTNTPIAKKLRFMVRNSAPTTLYMAGVALYAGSLSIDHTDAPEDIVTTVNFNKVMETSSLYERIIGYQTDGQNAIARHVMTSQLFQSEISKTENKILNATGGRNYYPDSAKSITSTRYVLFPVKAILEKYVGETWTFSFDCWINSDGIERQLAFYRYQGNGISLDISKYFNPTKKRQRFSFTGKVIDTIRTDLTGLTDGAMFIYDHAGSNSYTVTNVMLERGNIATDWSPAPEDLETITTSKITQLSDSISLGLFNKKGLVTGGQFGQNGVYIKGQLIKLDGTVTMDDAFVRKLMVDTASVNTLTALAARFGSIVSAYIDAGRITTGQLTGINIRGGILSALNGAVDFNLNNGELLFKTNNPAIKRTVPGYPNQMVKFETNQFTTNNNQGVWMDAASTIIGSNRYFNDYAVDNNFTGIRIINAAPKATNSDHYIDRVELIGDRIVLTHTGDFFEKQSRLIFVTNSVGGINYVFPENLHNTKQDLGTPDYPFNNLIARNVLLSTPLNPNQDLVELLMNLRWHIEMVFDRFGIDKSKLFPKLK